MSTTTSQQFEGSTIEEALAAAVECFGDDLEVIDAQRVRRRKALGVRRQDRFEVTATRRGTVEPKGFQDVLARMVDRVDDAERSLGAELADTSNAWWGDAEFVVPSKPESDPSPRPSISSLADSGPASAQPELEIDVRTVRAEQTQPRHAALAEDSRTHTAPARPADPAPPTATERSATGPGWSADSLRALGLPAALVGRLRTDELHEDLDWVAALAKAIGELLDAASTMSGSCELTGHGAASAVQLIRGACDGFRVGSIVIDERAVPATPLELSLAIRSQLGTQHQALEMQS